MSAVIAALTTGGDLSGVTGITPATFASARTLGGFGSATGNDTNVGYPWDAYQWGFAYVIDKDSGYVAIASVTQTVVKIQESGTASMALGSSWTVYEIIPEPATAMLALAGIGMLIAQKRKRA